jgi:hypothetical protein
MMSTRVWQRASVAVSCAAVVLGASACGSSGGSSSSGRIQASIGAAGSDKHEDAFDVCKLVTAADASKLFGTTATPSGSSSFAATTGACVWNASRASARYTLISYIYDTPAALDAAKAARATAVQGVGDRAYVSAVGSSAYEVWFLKGRRVARLRFGVAPAARGSKPPSAASQSAAVLRLARTVAGRM